MHVVWMSFHFNQKKYIKKLEGDSRFKITKNLCGTLIPCAVAVVLLLLFCCCCAVAAVLLLLCCCCCVVAVALLLLCCSCCAVPVVLLLLCCCCCAVAVVRFLLCCCCCAVPVPCGIRHQVGRFHGFLRLARTCSLIGRATRCETGSCHKKQIDGRLWSSLHDIPKENSQ